MSARKKKWILAIGLALLIAGGSLAGIALWFGKRFEPYIREQAVEYLRKSIDLGLGGADAIAADPDLKSLQGNEHFEALLAKLRQGAAVKPH